MDVAATIAGFKERLLAQGYAESTMGAYGFGLDRFREYLDARNISDLRTVTKSTMLAYQALIMTGAQSLETKALRIRPVKRLFEYLTTGNQLLINPAEGIIETNRRHRKVGQTLTREEMQKLLQQPNRRFRGGIRDRCIMEVLYATAIRRNELLSLELLDVDLDEGLLFVRKGKGSRQRIVPLGKTAIHCLHDYLVEVRRHYCRNNPRENRLFLTSEGKPLTVGALSTSLFNYRKRAGITTSASPHVFRRSCATHILSAGADIRFIQELLGHTSIATTQQYCKVVPIEIKQTHQETHPNERDSTDSGIS
jgi:integrase/recombinase XerD